MTRYQFMRKLGFDPLTAGLTAFMNWVHGHPEGEIHIMHTVLEYDPEEV